MPMILEFGLVRGQFSDVSSAPAELRFDLLISAEADYQLYYNNIPLISGHLKKGDNPLSIPSTFMLEESGSYLFFLETYAGAYHFKYEITLQTDLHVLPPPSAIDSSSLNSLFTVQSNPPLQYELEVYIRGNLAGKSRKKIYTGLSQSMRKALHKSIFEGRKNPRDPNNGSILSLPNQSLSISGIPALVYSLLKKKSTAYIPKARAIEVEFIRKREGSLHKRIKGTIAVSYRIMSQK